MGVDYSPVAGFTVDIPEELNDSLKKKYEEDWESWFDALDIPYGTIGSCYSGDTKDIPIFAPKSAIDLDNQLQDWLSKLNARLGTTFSPKDVRFVQEIYVW